MVIILRFSGGYCFFVCGQEHLECSSSLSFLASNFESKTLHSHIHYSPLQM